MKKKVIIMGGGIGGLTVAHELADSNNKYEIHIYEKNSIIGGMARSGVKIRNGVELPTEYCWRIYGPNYDNLRSILKQIPLKNDREKTVHDNLVDISDYMVADQNTIIHMNNRLKTLLEIRHVFKYVPFRQKYTVLSKILYCFLISTDRLNKLDNTSWNEFIDSDNILCHDMKKYIIDIMGPYLGADARQVNVPSVAKTLESFKVFNRPISVMNSPTNEAWFDHWKVYLENKGVYFHMNSEISKIESDGNTIQSITLENNELIKGDIFFCSLPVEKVSQITSLSIPGITELAQRGHQLMVSIQLYFDKKINFTNKYTAMYIPDSPWQLVIEPQGSIWGKTYSDIHDLWSVGLCDHIRPGNLIKKPFLECSHLEIQQEVWHQILNSELCSHLALDKVCVLDYNVWDTYQYNGKLIETHEPKFSTNKGTYFLRPKNKTEYENLYFATGYTQTETDMFEMESAAESGKRAARYLEKHIKVFSCDRPLFLTPYRFLDAIFPKFNLYRFFPIGWFCLGLPISMLFSLFTPIKRWRHNSRAN